MSERLVRILALDVGGRRTGVAISDPTGTIARPLDTIDHRSVQQLVAAVVALVAEYGVAEVVVGRPLSLDGTVGPQAQRVDRHAELLARALDVPVVRWDERFSTAEADEVLMQTRNEKARRRARSNGEIDAIAAAIILRGYLESRGQQPSDAGIEPSVGWSPQEK